MQYTVSEKIWYKYTLISMLKISKHIVRPLYILCLHTMYYVIQLVFQNEFCQKNVPFVTSEK